MSEVKTGKMKTYKIRVTKADIKKGKPQEGDACPVFLAIRRKIDTVETVNADDITFRDGNGYRAIATPYKPRKWITRFDDFKPVRPFSFTLNVP